MRMHTNTRSYSYSYSPGKVHTNAFLYVCLCMREILLAGMCHRRVSVTWDAHMHAPTDCIIRNGIMMKNMTTPDTHDAYISTRTPLCHAGELQWRSVCCRAVFRDTGWAADDADVPGCIPRVQGRGTGVGPNYDEECMACVGGEQCHETFLGSLQCGCGSSGCVQCE